MKAIYCWMMLGLLTGQSISAQKIFKLEIKQQDPIQIDAGQDTSLCMGSRITLGGQPTATGGHGKLYYSWFPSENLSDPTSSNPVAIIDKPIIYTLFVMDDNACIAQDFIEVKADYCTGILQTSLQNEVSIFPNPVYNQLFISGLTANFAAMVTIRLINYLGQVVQEENVESAELSNLFEWNLNKHESGLYFIQILIDMDIILKKIQIR